MPDLPIALVKDFLLKMNKMRKIEFCELFLFTHKAKVVGKALLAAGLGSFVRLFLFNSRHAPPCDVLEAATLIRQAVLADAVSETPVEPVVLEAWLRRMVDMHELEPATASLLRQPGLLHELACSAARDGISNRGAIARVIGMSSDISDSDTMLLQRIRNAAEDVIEMLPSDAQLRLDMISAVAERCCDDGVVSQSMYLRCCERGMRSVQSALDEASVSLSALFDLLFTKQGIRPGQFEASQVLMRLSKKSHNASTVPRMDSSCHVVGSFSELDSCMLTEPDDLIFGPLEL